MNILKFIKSKDFYIYLLALLPVLSLFMVSMAILIFIAGALCSFILNNKYKVISLKPIGFLIVFILPFLLYVVSLLWAEDFHRGINFMSKTLAFFVIPVTIFILRPFTNTAQIKRFIQIFICSSVTSVLITAIFLLINIENILNQHDSYWINIRLRESIELVPIIGEHVIYFSLLMATALILIFYNRFKKAWVNFTFILILIAGIALASSKGVILSLLAVGLIAIYQNIRSKKQALLVVVVSLIGFSVLVYISPIKSRINEIVESRYVYPQEEVYNSYNLRMAIYNCSFSLLEKTPLYGFSPADTQSRLNECYTKFKTQAFDEFNYNTHNQYLDYFLSFGPFGLLLILISFSFFLRIAILNKDKEYFSFLILFYLVFLTENILIRNTGIVLFTTFNCLFAFSNVFLHKNNF
ncbi:O-antigen ligase family protein [Winogradskyella ursingii]|uniref:O-antigen ligase family protein n=1 Tax=Winogradskyella ursingii TaxID=2686079 RepID=UPI0015C99FD9|nr:O-antigen ligase family protein [Winogradskyella ursingii]